MPINATVRSGAKTYRKRKSKSEWDQILPDVETSKLNLVFPPTPLSAVSEGWALVHGGRKNMANQQGGAAGAASRIAVSGVLVALSALSTLSSLVCAAPSSGAGVAAARQRASVVRLGACGARLPGASIRAQVPLRLRGGEGGEGEADGEYSNLPRESKVYIAKMAEQAERFEEMVSATKSIAKMGVDLTVEERSLLSVAYKNVVGARRASWKIISSIEQKETDEQNLSLIRTYLVKVEKELSDVCREIISLLGTYLIPSAAEAEPKVFYLKMHGDYWRYLAEVANGDERKVTASALSLARSLCLTPSFSLFACALGLTTIHTREILVSRGRDRGPQGGALALYHETVASA